METHSSNSQIQKDDKQEFGRDDEKGNEPYQIYQPSSSMATPVQSSHSQKTVEEEDEDGLC